MPRQRGQGGQAWGAGWGCGALVLSTLPRPGSKCCPLPRPGSSTTATQAPPLVAARGLAAALGTSGIPHHPHTHRCTPKKPKRTP